MTRRLVLIENDRAESHAAASTPWVVPPNELYRVKFLSLLPGITGGQPVGQGNLNLYKRGYPGVPILLIQNPPVYTPDGVTIYYGHQSMYVNIDLEEGDTINTDAGTLYMVFDRYSSMEK